MTTENEVEEVQNNTPHHHVLSKNSVLVWGREPVVRMNIKEFWALLDWVETVRDFFRTTREKFSDLPGTEWQLEEELEKIWPRRGR